MESFQPSGASTHRPLQGNEIRVVTLHPASFDDPVSCTLDHVVLDGPRDDYIAISYTWGDPTQTKDIDLNGHSYPVTTNLHLALTYLRNEDKPRRLWIDSLCINQRDVAERNAQILRMRDVFAFAAEVNIWLGDYGSTYDRWSWRRAFHRCIKGAVEDKEGNFHRQLPAPVSVEVRLVMDTLLRRPWFRRMWVIQEVAVRNWKEDGEKVKFLVGHLSLTWSILGGVHVWSDMELQPALSTLSFWTKLSPGRSYKSNGFFQIRTAWEAEYRVRESPMESLPQTRPQRLGSLLSKFVKFKVTDPRDRIYSLLGLLYGPEEVPNDLAPDYSKPVDVVLHAYATWMLRTGACIDILSLNSRQRVGRRCPSWVPDFQGQPQNFWHCPVDSSPIRILHDDRVLEIDALTIGTIHITGKRCDILAMSAAKDIRETCQNCRQYLLDCEVWIRDHATDSTTSHDSPRNKLSKYFKQSYTSYSHTHKLSTDDMFSQQHYDDIVRDLEHPDLDGTRTAIDFDRDTFAILCSEFIAKEFDGFTPFICDNGKLEFCDSRVDVPEPGDVLCLLRGSSKQYILRRAPPGSLGEWTMVGTTYNASEFNYVELDRDGRSTEEVNIAYTELWTKNADKIFKAVIC